MSSRSLKKKLRILLSLPDQTEAHRQLLEMPLKQSVSPLLSFLYAGDDLIKWHAVALLGRVVSEIANTNLEAARVVMRRLMWNLNDESGGIGWGSPEAMGEIMAQNETLAREYSAILISYIRPDGNYIEHEMLQRGVLWGIGRLAQARSESVEHAVYFLEPYITADDPMLRGLTLWIAQALPTPLMTPMIEELAKDDTIIKLYRNEQITECRIGHLAKEALSACNFC